MRINSISPGCDLLSIDDARKLLGSITKQRLYQIINRYDVTVQKIGDTSFLKRDDVEQLKNRPTGVYIDRRSSGPRFTLRACQLLFISNRCLAELNISNISAAIVRVDKQNSKIAIKFIEKFDITARGCCKLLIEKTGVSFRITHVLRFLRAKNIQKSINFEITRNDSELVIDISALVDQPE